MYTCVCGGGDVYPRDFHVRVRARAPGVVYNFMKTGVCVHPCVGGLFPSGEPGGSGERGRALLISPVLTSLAP